MLPPPPNFSMNLSGSFVGHVITFEWYLSAIEESKKSFLPLLLRVIVKAAQT